MIWTNFFVIVLEYSLVYISWYAGQCCVMWEIFLKCPLRSSSITQLNREGSSLVSHDVSESAASEEILLKIMTDENQWWEGTQHQRFVGQSQSLSTNALDRHNIISSSYMEMCRPKFKLCSTRQGKHTKSMGTHSSHCKCYTCTLSFSTIQSINSKLWEKQIAHLSHYRQLWTPVTYLSLCLSYKCSAFGLSVGLVWHGGQIWGHVSQMFT